MSKLSRGKNNYKQSNSSKFYSHITAVIQVLWICNNTKNHFFNLHSLWCMVLLSNLLDWSGGTADPARMEGIQCNHLPWRAWLVSLRDSVVMEGSASVSVAAARSASAEGSLWWKAAVLGHAWLPSLLPCCSSLWPLYKDWGSWGQRLADVS